MSQRLSLRGPLLWATAISLFLVALFYVVPTQLPFLLGEMGGDSSITGLVIGWMVMVQALASLSYRWVSRLGFSNVALLSLTLMSAGMTIVGTSSAIAQVLVGLSISALGVGLVMPNLNSWISDNTSSATRARAIGALISAMFLGQFVSPVIAEPVIQGGDTAPAFLAAGVLSLVAAITVLALSVAKIAQSDSTSP